MDLADRVALITGGKRIGAVVATELARRGADVALVYRTSRTEAEETADAIRALGRRSAVLRADLAAPDAAEHVVNETVGQLGRLDVLVNMASMYRMTPFDELTRRGLGCADGRRPSRGLALRAARRSRICAAYVEGASSIFRIGRRAADGRGIAATSPYYVAKAGVVALTEALALELASDQILVNAVAPGPIVAPEGTSDEEFADVERATPLGRWGGEIEIAKTVLALVESDFITGETIRVDGGRHLK